MGQNLRDPLGAVLAQGDDELLGVWAGKKPASQRAGVHQSFGVGRIDVAFACVVPRGDGVPVPRQCAPEKIGDAGEAPWGRCYSLVSCIHN